MATSSKEARQRYTANRRARGFRTANDNHGVSPAWVDEQLYRQDYVCVLCPQELSLGVCPDRKDNGCPNIDHDHFTGRIRGLLCRRCNLIMSKWLTVEIAENAIQYLEDDYSDQPVSAKWRREHGPLSPDWEAHLAMTKDS